MYMVASGLSSSDIPQERKRAVLIQCLGLEGKLVFATLGVAETYAATREKLTEYFGGKKNVMVERFKFRQRSQRQGDSVREYVAALWELAATCRFGVMHDELIQDQLIEKTLHSRIRKRLLMEKDTITCDETVTLAAYVKEAIAEAKAIEGIVVLRSAEVGKVETTSVGRVASAVKLRRPTDY